jgi:hypothetical protein
VGERSVDGHERLCALELALGQARRCPGAACPFWVDAPGVGLCLLGGEEESLGGRPELARELIEVRETLQEQQLHDDERWDGGDSSRDAAASW